MPVEYLGPLEAEQSEPEYLGPLEEKKPRSINAAIRATGTPWTPPPEAAPTVQAGPLQKALEQTPVSDDLIRTRLPEIEQTFMGLDAERKKVIGQGSLELKGESEKARKSVDLFNQKLLKAFVLLIGKTLLAFLELFFCLAALLYLANQFV
jgi:hypothetical protein